MQIYLTLFALIQAIGAIMGAGGSVVGELAYLKAIQDGRIDNAERAHLRLIAHTLRYGMILLLIGSIGLVLTDYIFGVALQPALTSVYWNQMTYVIIVITAAWMLSRGHLSFWLGSAAVFTGWWFLAFIDLGRFPLLSWGATLAAYLVATLVLAGIFVYARMLTAPKA